MSAPSNAPTAESRDSHRGQIAAIVFGFTGVIAIAVLAFAAPAVDSGPHDLPLVVSGPSRDVVEFSTQLEASRPGTFVVTAVDSPSQAAGVIRDGDAIGGVALARTQVTIQTVAGAGSVNPSLMRQVGSQIASWVETVTYSEFVPTTPQDPARQG